MIASVLPPMASTTIAGTTFFPSPSSSIDFLTLCYHLEESVLYKTKKQHSEPTAAKNKAVEMEYQTQEIPSSIVIDILGRLPLKTILLCRRVCKAWNTMLSENYFYMLYGGHSPTSLILQVKGPSISCLRSVCLVEAGDNSSITCRDLYISRGSWKRVPNFRYQLGNSCNGLICLRELPSREPVAIWNPIMGQFSFLPKPISVSDDKVVSGFGFCSRTNKYKVLRIFHENQVPQSQWTTEICDFDIGIKWRRIADTPCLLPSRIPGFYLSNSLHWILDYSDSTSSSDELICCFNFMDERFWFSPAPPIFSSNRRFQHHWSNLGVLQGSLSICSIDARAFRPDVQVWVMEEYGVTDSWVRKLSFRDPAVEWWDPHRWLQIVNVLQNGKIVILCAHRFVLLYDPEDKSFMIMKSLNFPAIAHCPCLISLKDVVKRDSAWFSSGPSVAYL
ncbi:hypothetical protein Droror1_Dr00019451 [Drosera rotundifolia]